MIDCHVLHLSGERADWAEACARSLAATSAHVRVHHRPGIVGDWFEARRRAYRFGDAPFVSFVDPDDEVLPGAFERCLERLSRSDAPVAVFTRSLARTGDSCHVVETNIAWPHPLIVARREAVIEALDSVKSDRELALHLGRMGRFPKIDWFGYVWRDHAGGLHRRGFSHAKTVINSLEDKP